MPPDYVRVPPVQKEKTLADVSLRQRPSSQNVMPLKHYQEDHIYHKYQVGRVVAQMCRPFVGELSDGTSWGGYNLDQLRIAALARAVQTKFYLHGCTPRYCLKDRNSCRFFFPWPCQPQQQYDYNMDRIALERKLPEDDQWLNPHNLSIAMFSPSTVHLAPFDPEMGADQARQYAGKYAAKPEQHYYMESEQVFPSVVLRRSIFQFAINVSD